MAEPEDAAGGEDMRAMLAQQLLTLRPRDLLGQTAVMLANQAAIRLGLASPEHRDREQAREAIDALAGIVELLVPLAPPDEIEALRRDLAQLRMAFVQSAEAPPAPAPAGDEPPGDADRHDGSDDDGAAGDAARGDGPDDHGPEDDGPGGERPSIWTPRGEV